MARALRSARTMLFCDARYFRATLAVAVLGFAAAAPAAAETTTARVPTAYATVMRSINPHMALGQSRVYANSLLANARSLDIDPTLMMAVVTVESHWDASAVSIHGAEGLGQLKPGTAHELGVDPRLGASNLRGLALYLHRLLSLFHDARQPMHEALAGYNAGPYAVQSYGGVPPGASVQRYVKKVMNALAMVRKRLGPAVVAAGTHETKLADPLIAKITEADAAFWGATR